MWIRFENGDAINMDRIIAYCKEQYSTGILFHSNNFSFTLYFSTRSERDDVIKKIDDVLSKSGVHLIDATPTRDRR